MTIDERELAELTQRSRDVHADAMHEAREPLAEIVEVGQEQRSRNEIDPEAGRVFASKRNARLGKGLGLLGGVGIGAAILGLFERPAFADKDSDIQMLQTAASIEVLAIAAYEAVLGLPFAGDLPAVVQTFVTTTKDQHAEHLAAFNAAATALGGAEQTMADPVLAKVVEDATPGLTGPGPVLELAIAVRKTARRRPTSPTSVRWKTRTPRRSRPASWVSRRSTSRSSSRSRPCSTADSSTRSHCRRPT